jgi:transposase-like protein
MNTKQLTLGEALRKFPDNDSCKAFLERKRWPDGMIKCPRCGSKAYRLPSKPFYYLCKSGAETVDKQTGEATICHKRNGYRFSVISRTVFENTNYPLLVWFRVILLMLHSKKGMSAHQIHRTMGTGSYETAWYLCHRIRAAMQDNQFTQLMGEVEADETWIGGKERNKHLGHRGNWASQGKTQVIGAIARKGNVVCKMIDEAGFGTHENFVRHVVSRNVSLVATDEAAHYRHLSKAGLPHDTVNHSHDEYVRGRVHTQNIESFWSLLKRGIIGNYHKVSAKYLPLYLNEFTFRFNNRKNPDIFDEIIAGC